MGATFEIAVLALISGALCDDAGIPGSLTVLSSSLLQSNRNNSPGKVEDESREVTTELFADKCAVVIQRNEIGSQRTQSDQHSKSKGSVGNGMKMRVEFLGTARR